MLCCWILFPAEAAEQQRIKPQKLFVPFRAYKLNMVTKKLESYISASHHYSNKMNGDIIKDIYQDEENRIWMAVFPIGITICSQNWPEYEWLRNTDEGTNLVSNQITYLLEDSDGDLWATTTNGVYMYNNKTKKWRSMLTSYHQIGRAHV